MERKAFPKEESVERLIFLFEGLSGKNEPCLNVIVTRFKAAKKEEVFLS